MLERICNGNYDSAGGYHEDGLGWGPNGFYCGVCDKESCAGCPKYE